MKEFIDKLIEKLEKERDEYQETEHRFEEDYGGMVALDLAISIVNQLAEEYINTSTEHINCSTISKMETVGWISCSERLPSEKDYDDGYVEPSDDVLVFTKYGSCKVSRYWGNRRNQRDYYDWVDIKLRTDEVIAWMPLPAPYTEGE